ncbi:DNA gyrase inhibitor YacG [Chitinasiproducens palmae]|uniref:DNA gyrase inhibitor YacG n=1 Tax=Chitinasiproducens palmae TaxID=1770053 RepID=UPI000B87E224|nr:DNA gyrase inhibitor YacG [Chitinasiproducens palmae]
MATFVNCPTCGKKTEWTTANAFRPFCSERCKQIDLGAWASEQYSIGSSDTPPPSEDDRH